MFIEWTVIILGWAGGVYVFVDSARRLLILADEFDAAGESMIGDARFTRYLKGLFLGVVLTCIGTLIFRLFIMGA